MTKHGLPLTSMLIKSRCYEHQRGWPQGRGGLVGGRGCGGGGSTVVATWRYELTSQLTTNFYYRQIEYNISSCRLILMNVGYLNNTKYTWAINN